jgi:hypothetical protein
MARRAFVIVARWPYDQLTCAGRITWWCTGGTEAHLGLFIPCCTPEEVVLHSAPFVAHPTARDQEHVAFDYMSDKYPRFQSQNNPRYYTSEADVWLYPILVADAADIHAACLEAANAKPYNNFWYRFFNGICWCWPAHCCASNTPVIAPSTCVALSMRIIARAKADSFKPYVSDAATFEELGMDRWSCATPCVPRMLTGHSPRSGLEALQEARVLGAPVQGFEKAIAQCKGSGPTLALGSMYPLLSLIDRA